jgi:hypothetical protein
MRFTSGLWNVSKYTFGSINYQLINLSSNYDLQKILMLVVHPRIELKLRTLIHPGV